MRYAFLIDTYRTEIEKVLSVWAMFEDVDLHRRPHSSDRRGRNLLEHMVHQSVSEDVWFSRMLVDFFEVKRSRAWIMTRRIAHTAHHRGQQTALLRVFGRDLHSTYGPTADTGGLMQHKAPVIYAYPDLAAVIEEEAGPRRKAERPAAGDEAATERPGT